jgi:hypothetical protein
LLFQAQEPRQLRGQGVAWLHFSTPPGIVKSEKCQRTPRPRIVIIEDNLADAFLLIQELTPLTLDHRVEVLQDGARALAFVRELATEPVLP